MIKSLVNYKLTFKNPNCACLHEIANQNAYIRTLKQSGIIHVQKYLLKETTMVTIKGTLHYQNNTEPKST